MLQVWLEKEKTKQGLPTIAQRDWQHPWSTGTQVRPQAGHSGLRTPCCGSVLNPNLGTPYATEWPKKGETNYKDTCNSGRIALLSKGFKYSHFKKILKSSVTFILTHRSSVLREGENGLNPKALFSLPLNNSQFTKCSVMESSRLSKVG